jgi:hypothetical protein
VAPSPVATAPVSFREVHLRTIADVLRYLKPGDDEDIVFQRDAAEAHINELLAVAPVATGETAQRGCGDYVAHMAWLDAQRKRGGQVGSDNEVRQELADQTLRRIAERYKNCSVNIYPDLPELTPVEAVLRCAQEEGFRLVMAAQPAGTPDKGEGEPLHTCFFCGREHCSQAVMPDLERERASFERGRWEALEQAAQACENEKRCYADSHRAHDEFCHDQDAAAIRALAPAAPAPSRESLMALVAKWRSDRSAVRGIVQQCAYELEAALTQQQSISLASQHSGQED